MVISGTWVIRPLVWPIKMLDKSFGQQTLQIAEEDDVILAVEVNPTAVTARGIVALRLARRNAIENLVKRLAVNVAKDDVEILAERHVTITVDN